MAAHVAVQDITRVPLNGCPMAGIGFCPGPGLCPSAEHLLWALLAPLCPGLCPLQRELGVRQVGRAGTPRVGMN